MNAGILVIDDCRIFTDFPVGQPGVTYCRTLRAGMQTLLSGRIWQEMYLDHDLSGDTTIRPLVAYMAEAAQEGTIFPIINIYVCSDNPDGRDWIIGRLETWYNVSFNQPRYSVDWGLTPA